MFPKYLAFIPFFMYNVGNHINKENYNYEIYENFS